MTSVVSDSATPLPEWKQRRSGTGAERGRDVAMPNDPEKIVAQIMALYPTAKIVYQYQQVQTRGFANPTILCIATLQRGQDVRSHLVGKSSKQMCFNRLYARYQALENLLIASRQAALQK